MILWFHSTYEQELDNEFGPFNYDSFTDSKLFMSLTACSQDADMTTLSEFEDNTRRYKDACRRREIAIRAMDVLAANNIDVSELYWQNYATKDAPEFHAPPERYIYSIIVEE